MGGKSQPNYGDLAVQQGEANEQVVREQTYANRPTQYTPWGYTAWQAAPYTDPGSGEQVTRWEQTQGLTPELQDILNKQIAIQGGRTDLAGLLTGRMGAEFGTPMDWRGLSPAGAVPTGQFTLPEELQRNLSYAGIGDISNPNDVQKYINTEGLSEIEDPYQTRQRAEDAMYSQAMSRLTPQFDSEAQALEIKLRNMGIGPEDASWKAQFDALNRRKTDAINQAIWSATDAGRAESGQMFGQQLGRRQQGFGERESMYDAYNQGAGQQFGQTLAGRNLYTGERERQAMFGNEAAQQAYAQALGANQANWQQALQGSQYANAIRQQQIAEQMQQRGFSLNEINALLSGQQVGLPQMPNFSQAASAQPAPIYQAGADQGSVDAALNPWNALIGAGGSVLGGAFSGGYL